mmetsp:Transcript_18803/g.44560  ORF Transcript_18803/g.44560 Transcript_18803/m.44560 type:complete len:665 (-) Transcript_18803:108-2102(-)
MTSDTHLSIHLAQRLREEANEAFNQDDFGTSLKLYMDGLDALNQAVSSNHPTDSIRSLRLTLHSNLAETYLRLGMGHMAKDHCTFALTIDENDRAVHERFRHAERMAKHHDGVVGKVNEKIGSLETAKNATWLSAMVEVAKELTYLAQSDDLDPYLTVKCWLAAAESDMVLAKSLLQEAPKGKAAKIAAKIHFNKCCDLYEEVSGTCMPYCDPSGAFGFVCSDTSSMACASRWRANLLCAKAELKHSKALMSIQLIESSLCPLTYAATLSSWDENGRTTLHGSLSSAKQHLMTGLDIIKSLDRTDKVPASLKGQQLSLEVEILLQLLSIEWIGLDLRNAKVHAAAIEKTTKTALRPGTAIKERWAIAVCDAIKQSQKSLFPSNERAMFPVAKYLLSARIYAYMISGATEKQIDMLRQLLKARRLYWISQAVPSYASTSADDASEDNANILQLIEALKKTGRDVGNECAICFEPLVGSEGGVVKALSCDHLFHHNCCQRYYTCSGKVSERDLSNARTDQHVTRELPCPTCRKMHRMRILRDGSVSEVYLAPPTASSSSAPSAPSTPSRGRRGGPFRIRRGSAAATATTTTTATGTGTRDFSFRAPPRLPSDNVTAAPGSFGAFGVPFGAGSVPAGGFSFGTAAAAAPAPAPVSGSGFSFTRGRRY